MSEEKAYLLMFQTGSGKQELAFETPLHELGIKPYLATLLGSTMFDDLLAKGDETTASAVPES